jgi:hypothetical protein
MTTGHVVMTSRAREWIRGARVRGVGLTFSRRRVSRAGLVCAWTAACSPSVVATGLHAASLAILLRVSCYARMLLLRDRPRPGIVRRHSHVAPRQCPLPTPSDRAPPLGGGGRSGPR